MEVKELKTLVGRQTTMEVKWLMTLLAGDSRKGNRGTDKGKAEPAKDKKPPPAKDAKAGKAAKEKEVRTCGDFWGGGGEWGGRGEGRVRLGGGGVREEDRFQALVHNVLVLPSWSHPLVT